MAEHTPGPWAGALTEDDEFFVTGVLEGEHVQIAVITDSIDAFENTALIAAGPDLLEALEALLILDDPTLFIDIDTAQLFDDARAAIAKARGE